MCIRDRQYPDRDDKEHTTIVKNRNRVSSEKPGFYRLAVDPVSYTHLRAHETVLDLVCRLLLEKKKK